MPRESALARALLDDDVNWGLNEQLLALAIDVLRQANYQRAGGKGQKPKPLPRPGVSKKDQPLRHGSVPDRSPDEVIAYLDRFRPQHSA